MVTAGQAILPPGAAQPTADTRHARRDYYEQSASLSDTFSGCRAPVPRVARSHRLTENAKSFKVQSDRGGQREKVPRTSGECSLTGNMLRGTGNAKRDHASRRSAALGND